MDKLIIGIGHEIDEVPSDFDGEVPDDFAASLLSLSTKLSFVHRTGDRMVSSIVEMKWAQTASHGRIKKLADIYFTSRATQK